MSLSYVDDCCCCDGRGRVDGGEGISFLFLSLSLSDFENDAFWEFRQLPKKKIIPSLPQGLAFFCLTWELVTSRYSLWYWLATLFL